MLQREKVMSKKKRIQARGAEISGTKSSKNDTIVQSSGKSSNDSDLSVETSKSHLISTLKSNWLMVLLIAFLSLGALGASLKYLEDDARREMAKRESRKSNFLDKSEESFLNRINPFLPAPVPNPTPQLSKEYVVAPGSGKILTVEDAGANAAAPADIAVWRPSSGDWWVMGQTGSQQVTQTWGMNDDKPVPGDYDGDGKTDFSIFRPSNNNWYILYSAGGGNQILFGTGGDKPAQADYDGDGRTDAAIFRPSTATWYISKSSDSSWLVETFGQSTDTPVPADFDGDGRADIAVWRSSSATFHILRSSNNQTQSISFGQADDFPVPGDYDGDGRADAAVWRGGVYQWHILYSSTQTTEGFTFGNPQTDIYVQNDYDGDGKVDRAFWRPSTGVWHIVQSSKRGQADEVRTVQWGITGDVPVPAFYRR